MKRSIVFAALSCFVLASGCVGYEDPDQLDLIEAELAGDADADGIPDGEDNCPGRSNVEQHDSDEDGLGDDCDFTLVSAGSTEEPLVVHVSGNTNQRTVPIAILANDSGAVGTWEATSDRAFAQVPAGGSVSIGARHLLPLQINPGQLPMGDHVVRVAVRVKIRIVIIIIIIKKRPATIESPTFAAAATSCTFNVSMHKAKVTEGQGALEGKLELRITGHANNDTAVWPSSTGSDKMKAGDPFETIDKDITTVSVPVGTVKTISVDADVLELDSGTLGADDFGTASGTLALQCGAGPVTTTLTAALNSSGKVQVQFKAEQL